MRVRVLGPWELVDDSGQPLVVQGARQRGLVALLALQAGRVISADQLVDDLWPTEAPQQPANALQVVVSKVRKAVGADAIVTRPPGYALVIAEEEVDAGQFEHLIHAGRTALAADDTGSALVHFDEALRLWRGDPLAEFSDLPAVMSAVARLTELRASTVEDRFDALLASGRDTVLIADLQDAIAAMPFRERLRGQLMLALYRSGRQAEALRAADDARRVLAEELGLEPGAELRRLEAAILRQDEALEAPRAPSPPVAGREVSASAVPTNLRPALTSFVGRENDLTNIDELLDRHRLVTLIGAGGCGKTRLAAEHARRATHRFADGVWFATLEALTTGDAVSATVADAVGLSTADTTGGPASTAPDSLERLCTRLERLAALLVIDNCEHVIDDAARLVVELLAAAPDLRVLATSREALRVPGEVVWRVPSLASEDCVTLFAERARAASSTFELTDRDRIAVAEVCAQVDGMPLAIELAAARAGAFTVGQLADRLDDRFRLLSSGARTALPRHQTLRAVTDWSYDLLFDEERTVFERLTVFSGGCTLDAAEQVCAEDGLPPAEIGTLVGRLVDKSLVVADGSGRLRLLFSLADYGRERLAERHGAEAARDRHAAYFATLAERSIVDWRRPDGHPQVWWLSCLNTELDNLRAALAWSIERGDADIAQRLAGTLGWFWWHSGRAIEGYAWLGRAVTVDDTPPGVRAPALAWAAWLGLQTGDVEAAAARAGEAVSVSERAADDTSLGMGLLVSAQVAALDGGPDRAASYLDRAQQVHASIDDEWHKGIAASLRSLQADLRGDRSTAARETAVAIELLRSVGDICTLVPMLHGQSRSLQMDGELDDAEAAVREAHEISESYGLRGWYSATSERLGELSVLRGDNDAGIAHYRAAIDLARELALPAAEAAALEGLARAYREGGDPEAALRCDDAARAIGARGRRRPS